MQKRAAADVPGEVLGEFMAEKLIEQSVKMQAKVGNASCVLKELRIIDANKKLDVNSMVESIENGEWGYFPDPWLKTENIKNCRTCATYAGSIPNTFFDECAYGEEWGRIMLFLQCEEDAKYKVCIRMFSKSLAMEKKTIFEFIFNLLTIFSFFSELHEPRHEKQIGT